MKSKDHEILALILARGGSKGLPGKNIISLRGVPLIAYSIKSALEEKLVTRVIVSTDCEDIAGVAQLYGAEVPFMRPSELARDDTCDFPVIEHAIKWLKEHENYFPDFVIQVRPTVPLRPRGLFERAIKQMLENKNVDCVRTMAEPNESPYKMWKEGQNGCAVPLLESDLFEPYNMLRQQLPKVYVQTGHLEVIKIATIEDKKSLTGDKIMPVLVDRPYCVDIDTIDDLFIAEALLKSNKLDIVLPEQIDKKTITGKNFLPEKIDLLILDFDGVFTDNSVLVMENGSEAVFCNRSDGFGIESLLKKSIPTVVLSSEVNKVAEARCKKLKIPCYLGEKNKFVKLKEILKTYKAELQNVVYVGNDINDLECMRAVGCSIAVKDAYISVKEVANYTLSAKGGHGAIRELVDIISAT